MVNAAKEASGDISALAKSIALCGDNLNFYSGNDDQITAFMALGAFMLLVEFLMKMTFDLHFIGWSIYPLVVLFLFGGLLIYFAINSSAREIIERKLFF